MPESLMNHSRAIFVIFVLLHQLVKVNVLDQIETLYFFAQLSLYFLVLASDEVSQISH